MFKVLLIATGGGIGALLRYGLTGWVQSASKSTFPVGTLVVNALACLAVGFLWASLSGPIQIRPEYRAALIVGLLGGFSTFSTYGLETFLLFHHGQKWAAALNVVCSSVLGVAAIWVGYRLAQRCYGI